MTLIMVWFSVVPHGTDYNIFNDKKSPVFVSVWCSVCFNPQAQRFLLQLSWSVVTMHALVQTASASKVLTNGISSFALSFYCELHVTFSILTKWLPQQLVLMFSQDQRTTSTSTTTTAAAAAAIIIVIIITLLLLLLLLLLQCVTDMITTLRKPVWVFFYCKIWERVGRRDSGS